MEEDIKKIEQIIKRCDQCKFHECINCEICWNEVQAIKRVVNGYRELEENQLWSEATIKGLRESFIHKSVIREKMEEYKKLLMNRNRFSDVDRIKAINERILAYKELLEEE